MAHTYLKTATSKKKTPQSQPIPGKRQVQNHAGGFVFQLDDWKRLERFLILGSEGNTYYATERKMTADNVSCLERCLAEDSVRFLKTVVAISDGGRAPKNDPALLALAVAMAKGGVEAKREAAAVLPKVARIGTHLFHFVDMIDGMRGWGPVLCGAVSNWYLTKPLDALAVQLLKYQARDAWSHKDVLRKAHPNARLTDGHSALFRYVTKGVVPEDSNPSSVRKAAYELIHAFEEIKALPKPPAAKKADERRLVELIVEHAMPRECVPTEWLNSRAVWEALLRRMPMTAMIRNLGKMSSIGLLTPLSDASSTVVKWLAMEDQIKKARVHPIQILLALSTYKQGHGMKGSLTWKPAANVVRALDEAFYKAFACVPSTGKRFYIALDVSGSMCGGHVAGTPLTPREAAAALAMVTMRTEQEWHIAGFTNGSGRSMYSGYGSGLTDLKLTPSMSLDAAVCSVADMPFGGTDCALPMIDATNRTMKVDAFYVLTDNETWAGSIHPCQALREYRQRSGIPAKLIVAGLTSTGFSIADPSDPGMLDVVGFDSNVPALMSDFVSDGEIGGAIETE